MGKRITVKVLSNLFFEFKEKCENEMKDLKKENETLIVLLNNNDSNSGPRIKNEKMFEERTKNKSDYKYDQNKDELEVIEIPQAKLEPDLNYQTAIDSCFVIKDEIFLNLCDVLNQIINDKTCSSRVRFIPVLKATNNQIRQLDNYTRKKQLTLNFIRYGSRIEYKYFDGNMKMKEKDKNYKFSNAVGVDFKGRKFQINLSQMRILGESSFSTDFGTI